MSLCHIVYSNLNSLGVLMKNRHKFCEACVYCPLTKVFILEKNPVFSSVGVFLLLLWRYYYLNIFPDVMCCTGCDLKLHRGLFLNLKAEARARLFKSMGISQPHISFEHIWSICGGKLEPAQLKVHREWLILFHIFFPPLLPRNGTLL